MTDLKRRLGKLELFAKPARGPTALQVDVAADQFDANMAKLTDAIRTEIGELGAVAVMRRVLEHGSAAEMFVLLAAQLAELEIPQAILVADWAGEDLAAWKTRVQTLLRELLREPDEGEPPATANGHANGGSTC